MKIPHLLLNNGVSIPQIGFGLWRNTDEHECKNSVKWALTTGYRHFDDAQVYDNEQHLGAAIKESAVPRSDLFITTKISRANMWGTEVIPSFRESNSNALITYSCSLSS